MLSSRTAFLKLKNAPQFHAIRWETETEYRFERISGPLAQLGRTLMKASPSPINIGLDSTEEIDREFIVPPDRIVFATPSNSKVRQ
jgi:hypothetical protein